MKFQATGEHVAVLMDERSAESKEGTIYIPEAHREVEEFGTVESLGREAQDIGLGIEPGTRVHVRRTAGTEFRRGDRDIVVLKARAILAKVES